MKRLCSFFVFNFSVWGVDVGREMEDSGNIGVDAHIGVTYYCSEERNIGHKNGCMVPHSDRVGVAQSWVYDCIQLI